MTSDEYNARAIDSGEIDIHHVLGLLDIELEVYVKRFQRRHGLAVDGKCGPITRAAIEQAMAAPVRAWPLRCLPDGRRPVVTSRFKTRNPSRPTHCGIDLFYAWLDTDPEVHVGDGGAIRRRGRRRWWYPPGTQIVAAAAGTVTLAGPRRTGLRLWIDHGDGTRTGYFHCRELLVEVGDRVGLGDAIALPGDSPLGYDALHLHFEVSPAERYEPGDPEVWLASAQYLAS